MFSHLSPVVSRLVLASALLLTLSACASRPHNPDDPLETYNRGMFVVNERVDKALIRPVAKAYDKVVPEPAKIGVGNFFGNLGDPWIGVNNLLQGKVGDAFSDWMRFAFNSTFGLFGLLDIATPAGLAKNDEDFGQTLAVWGVGEGPYVVLPFLGPRTLRDAVVTPVDMRGDQVWSSTHVPTRNSLFGLRLVNTRYRLLGVSRTLEEGTLDRYAFSRDFYLQQRRYKVRDGAPLIHDDEDDFSDIEARGAPLSPSLAPMSSVAPR